MYLKFVTIFLCIATVFANDEVAVEEFSKASNLFASDVYTELTKSTTDNFIVSPYSAELILTLTQSGCKEETAKEMKSVLRLPDDDSTIMEGVKGSHFNTTKVDLYTLESANKMYIKKGFEVKEQFQNAATDVFKAAVEAIDFEKNQQAAKTMNAWVEEKTNHKITNLIDPNTLDEYSRVMLINALYFKGKWLRQFPPSQTREEDFYKMDDSVAKVNMMHHSTAFHYYESQELNAKFLELPFKGNDVSMIVVLPNENKGLESLESKMDDVLRVHQLRKEVVNVALPKFKIESNIKLKDILKNLGMTKAFDDSKADLSGIAGDKGDLVISDVVQKAFVEIDEKGGKAAAATHVHISYIRSGPIAPIPINPKSFVADHPFIFYIKIRNFILFVGRVLEPHN